MCATYKTDFPNLDPVDLAEWDKYFNLETAVQGDKMMQDSGSKDCVSLSPSTAVSRFNMPQPPVTSYPSDQRAETPTDSMTYETDYFLDLAQADVDEWDINMPQPPVTSYPSDQRAETPTDSITTVKKVNVLSSTQLQPKPFPCPVPSCLSGYTKISSFQKHMKNKHPDKVRNRRYIQGAGAPSGRLSPGLLAEIAVEIPTDSNTTVKKVNVFRSTQLQPKPFACPFKPCHRRYELKSDLKAHMKRCHIDHPEHDVILNTHFPPRSKVKEGNLFPCPVPSCLSGYTKISSFQKHMKNKHPDKGRNIIAQGAGAPAGRLSPGLQAGIAAEIPIDSITTVKKVNVLRSTQLVAQGAGAPAGRLSPGLRAGIAAEIPTDSITTVKKVNVFRYTQFVAQSAVFRYTQLVAQGAGTQRGDL